MIECIVLKITDYKLIGQSQKIFVKHFKFSVTFLGKLSIFFRSVEVFFVLDKPWLTIITIYA